MLGIVLYDDFFNEFEMFRLLVYIIYGRIEV